MCNKNGCCCLVAHWLRLNCVGSLKVLNNVTLWAPNLSIYPVALGIIGLFYVCNILTFYNSVCHIMLFHVSDLVQLLATLSLVLNSTFKFCVYFALSNRFRDSVICLCSKKWWNKLILTFYNIVSHVMLFQVSDLIQLLSTLSLVLNSTFKFCVYFALSKRFRDSVIGLCSNDEIN